VNVLKLDALSAGCSAFTGMYALMGLCISAVDLFSVRCRSDIVNQQFNSSVAGFFSTEPSMYLPVGVYWLGESQDRVVMH
jgi:hypothetical protein